MKTAEIEKIFNPMLDIIKKMNWQLAVSNKGKNVEGFIIGEKQYVNRILKQIKPK